ncbi:MAG: M28 family peptidase [Anaerolineales bacterium]|nr:M28 family peptidase [Anaerolineales bacterium]
MAFNHNPRNKTMAPAFRWLFFVFVLLALATSCRPGAPGIQSLAPTRTLTSGTQSEPPAQPTRSAEAVRPAIPAGGSNDPYELISQEMMFAYMQDLSAIQPYSGWRNSASTGEAEGLDYIAGRLGEFTYLAELGMQLERQEFRVFMGTETWETRLHLSIDNQQYEAPASSLRGPRDEIELALQFDSDGALNDSEHNPVVVEGEIALVRSDQEIFRLKPADVAGKIVFLDYAVIDRVVAGSTRQAASLAYELLEKRPAGLVLVTQNSFKVDESHGFGVADVSALNWVSNLAPTPVIYTRLEDLASAGLYDWDDLGKIQSARLTWDVDIFSPATSGNLVARIPGVDSSRAVILGAHVDSPNNPGAMDDGSGCVVLLETVRVLEAARLQPQVDLYLAWFGSEEIGLYGSAHFAATHQELLDRSIGMLQIDDLTRPLDGLPATLNLAGWSYWHLGDERLPWAEYLAQAGAQHGIDVFPVDTPRIYSDNSVFSGFDLPNADLVYADDAAFEATGSWHHAAHVHDPYDTVETARPMGGVLEEMARLTLAAALETGQSTRSLRVAPQPELRALFVASHSESIHMNPAALIDLGMALAWEGFDVDMIPYGQALTSDDLAGADLVFALPVHDYPNPETAPDAYDEAWLPEEAAVLEAYVADGGLLVLANSAHRLKYYNAILDGNEDWADANDLARAFGVAFQAGTMDIDKAAVDSDHPLMQGITSLALAPSNGVPFEIQDGQVLARARNWPLVALIDYGAAPGQVVVLADLGLLGDDGSLLNLQFWLNLARYARDR